MMPLTASVSAPRRTAVTVVTSSGSEVATPVMRAADRGLGDTRSLGDRDAGLADAEPGHGDRGGEEGEFRPQPPERRLPVLAVVRLFRLLLLVLGSRASCAGNHIGSSLASFTSRMP